MHAANMRHHLQDFARERAERRAARRAGGPVLAIVSGGPVTPPAPAFTPAQTAAEAEGVLVDYFRCGEEGRREIALVARDLAERDG